ncbi:MAG: P-loop NTPase [Microbacterium sp.]|nr:P-loop NTPase [Microbacterium sp.]
MSTVAVAIPLPRARTLVAELEVEGVHAVPASIGDGAPPLMDGVEALILPSTRAALTPTLIAACDRAGVRILLLGGDDPRLAARFGLPEPIAPDAPGWQVAAALAADPPTAPRGQTGRTAPPHRVIAVWGPHGAPGRSTLAVQLAVELTRAGRRTALLDADTVAPSLALLLGLSDDAPGIAAACRRAELGALDAAELSRLATTVETSAGALDVLAGLNRPGRWPELSAARLQRTLTACRDWAEDTVVDVSAAVDADDEATYDLAGPRRHAATAAVLREADAVIAVGSADPLGISRLVRDYSELRRLTAPAPVTVVINRVRQGPLGIDARGQIRRTLDRFAGISDVQFFPHDQRATDAALLHARPLTDVAPRSAFVAATRRLVSALAPAQNASTMIAPTAPHAPAVRDDDATVGSSRGSSRGVRRLRRAPGAPGG